MHKLFQTPVGRLLGLLALILVVGLQYKLWFGEGGIADHLTLKKQIADEHSNNLALTERNRVLKAEVLDLKHGLEAIEEHARLDLGLIKPGETFVQLSVLPPPVGPATSMASTQAGIGHLNEAEVPEAASQDQP